MKKILIFIPGFLGSEIKNNKNEIIWPPSIPILIEDIYKSFNENFKKKCFFNCFNCIKLKNKLYDFFSNIEKIHDLSNFHILPDKIILDLLHEDNSITGNIIFDIFGFSLYDNLFDFLNKKGYSKEDNLITFAYDWRQSNKISGMKLKKFNR